MATLIKVCGAAFSGTTMLDFMLGNAPEAFSCGEASFRFRPQRTGHFGIACRCGQRPCSVWSKIGDVPESRFHGTVLKDMGVSFVIDSSKERTWALDTQRWAVADGIKAYNLLLWKDPVDLAYSYWKREYVRGDWYSGFLSYYARFFEVGLPFRSVFLNDLLTNPERKLAEICAAVGMPYFKGKERFWEKRPHPMQGNHEVYRQTKDGNSRIRPSDAFPTEFEAVAEAVSARIASDSKVQQILETLRGTEISTRGSFRPGDEMCSVPRPYPYWYYLLRIREGSWQFRKRLWSLRNPRDRHARSAD